MPQAVIRNNHLTFAGVKYFRGNAPSVSLADYGKKKSPVTSQNYLAVHGRMPAPKIEVHNVTTVAIDIGQSRKADVELNLKVAGVTGSVKGSYEQVETEKVKLVKFDMSLGHVKDAVNRSPKVLDTLRSIGSSARIAYQVFVVMEAMQANYFTGASGISVSVLNNELKFTTSGVKVISITMDPGSTYAYLLCRPKWNSGRRQVDLFETDQWGPS